MCFVRGSNAAAQAADDARVAETQRQGRVTDAIGRINDTFGQFNNDFYAGRERAYSDYATPQAEDQFQKARRDLIFALADAGLTNSSVAGQRLVDLERDYGMRKAEIADAAKGYAQQARGDVESARSSLVQMAQGTADAALAGTSAVNEATRLAGGQQFSPIGTLFQNVTAGIGAMRAANDAEAIRNAGSKSSGVRVFQPGGSARTVGG